MSVVRNGKPSEFSQWYSHSSPPQEPGSVMHSASLSVKSSVMAFEPKNSFVPVLYMMWLLDVYFPDEISLSIASRSG